MSAYKWLLVATFVLGLSAPAVGDDDLSTVVSAFYEHGRGVVGSGVNLGVTGGDGMFDGGLTFAGFSWTGDPASVQSRPAGAVFAYLSVSAPYAVSPYAEFGYNPIGIFVYMAKDNNDAVDEDETTREPWDSFVALGLKARLGRWGSLRMYHRWYDVYHIDSQSDTEIQTNFHTWGGALSILF